MTEALQEFVDSRGVALRVDRERGVLRGVKLIGLVSRNGRRYRDAALEQAKSLYEEAKVNVNHPKDGPLAPRDYQDRLGVIRGVEFRSGEGLFGDLHFNPRHPLAEQLAWDAEHNPRNVGFSHNVLARLTREGENAVVEEITRVQSVDLVADPAATLGLYEQAADCSDQAAVDADETCRWDSLTVAVLALHRPDLAAEMRLAAKQGVQEELDNAQAQTAVLERRQRVVELLCEQGLGLAAGDNSVSPAFFEMLNGIEDEARLKQLIEERAELVRSGPAWNRLLREAPQSRDQTTLESRHQAETKSATDFAKAIKGTRG